MLKGAVNLSGNSSLTIDPGIYSQINVSGNASLFLNPGLYEIAGEGLSVTGNANLTGTGVMIYNAGSNFPMPAGGSFGGLTLAGNGVISLTPMDSGTYAGIVIFQSRDNTCALSLSGNGSLSLHGGVTYASAALLSESGNAQSEGPIVVSRLQISGNVSSSAPVAASGGAGTDATVGELLGGNLSLYVANPSGYLSQDERARIDDAIAGWDALLAPYHVTITEVAGADAANLVLEGATTSPVGGLAAGYSAPTNRARSPSSWDGASTRAPIPRASGRASTTSSRWSTTNSAMPWDWAIVPPPIPSCTRRSRRGWCRTPTITDRRIPDLNATRWMRCTRSRPSPGKTG